MSDILKLDIAPGDTGYDDWLQPFEKEDMLQPREWTFAMARAALRHIHPDCDFPEKDFEGKDPLKPYELWRNFASALIRQFGNGPETFELFDDWSSGRLGGVRPQKYKPDKIAEQFAGFGASAATMGTVEWWAKKGGWNPGADLLTRILAMPSKSVVDPKAQEELIGEVVRAKLSTVQCASGVDELMRITGLGRAVVKRAIKDAEKMSASQHGDAGNLGRVSQADILVSIGHECCELWRSTDPEPELFATVKRGENMEHLRLSSSQFKHFLTDRFVEKLHKAPSAESLTQAINVLSAHAHEQGEKHEAFLRVAQYGDALYLDLADEENNVVEITRHEWKLVKRPPVRLIRGAGKALPVPQRGGKITDLRNFINIDPEDHAELRKIAAWLVAALRPGFPFPILLVTGEQGTAKTTACNMLKKLLDPSVAQARGLPKTEDDLIVTARSNHVMMADNLTGIKAEMSDALCRLSTGGGLAKRKLYSDGHEYTIEARRPIIVNGINIPTSRQDLLDRSLHIELRPILGTERKEEDQLWTEFEKERPKLLGVVLDGVVAGLRNMDRLRPKVKTVPRMADFAMFAAAAMPAWGWKSQGFLDEYIDASSRLTADAGHSDAVLSAICQWIQSAKTQDFEGSAAQLLAILDMFKHNDIENAAWVREVDWPRQPNKLSRRMRAGAAGLRAMGVGYEQAGTTSGRLIRLWWGEKPTRFNSLTPARVKFLEADARNPFAMSNEAAVAGQFDLK